MKCLEPTVVRSCGETKPAAQHDMNDGNACHNSPHELFWLNTIWCWSLRSQGNCFQSWCAWRLHIPLSNGGLIEQMGPLSLSMLVSHHPAWKSQQSKPYVSRCMEDSYYVALYSSNPDLCPRQDRIMLALQASSNKSNTGEAKNGMESVCLLVDEDSTLLV